MLSLRQMLLRMLQSVKERLQVQTVILIIMLEVAKELLADVEALEAQLNKI